MATTGNIPIFARGERDNIQSVLEVIQASINKGDITYPTYVVAPKQKSLIFVDKDNTPIVLNNNFEIVDALPAVADADPDVIYYTTDGSYKVNPDYGTVENAPEFTPVGDTATIQTLEDQVSVLEGKVEQFVEQNTELVFASATDYPDTTLPGFPETGEDGKLYIDEDNCTVYSWDSQNSKYVCIFSKAENTIKFIELEEPTVTE